MGIIKKRYINVILGRYDKDVAIPYFSYKNFDGLHYLESSFNNSNNIELKYFIYNYDSFIKDKVIVFCHGIGPGHTAYLNEINELCKAGYKVITFDYKGCGASKGESLGSMNEPTRDLIDLLNHLNIKEEIILIGHSLGGYTSLNGINLRKNIHKAVIMSGFVSLYNELKFLLKLPCIAKSLCKYEKSVEPDYYGIDNLTYLKDTKDEILFIHSVDDGLVGYKSSTKLVQNLNNPNLSFLIVNNRKHNPNYTDEAVKYMNDTFATYQKLIGNKILDTDEKRIEFFKDKSIFKMTEQDKSVINTILEFIK